jgi:hypothetical protein
VQPPQIGVEMGDGVVGREDVVERGRRGRLDGGQLPQPLRVRPALGGQVGAGPIDVGDQQRHDHLGEERAGHVRHRWLDRAEPPVQRGAPLAGQRVRRAVGAALALLPRDRHQAVPVQPAEGGVDLPEGQRPGPGQPLVVRALELVAVLGARGEQPEQHVRGGHPATIL